MQTDNQINPYDTICSDETFSCKNSIEITVSSTGSTYPNKPNVTLP